jgi:hypothetical protein
MARNRKGPPDQAKHFQHDDYAHAGHQEAASHGHAPKSHSASDESQTHGTVKKDHPVETTPKGPSRGQ